MQEVRQDDLMVPSGLKSMKRGEDKYGPEGAGSTEESEQMRRNICLFSTTHTGNNPYPYGKEDCSRAARPQTIFLSTSCNLG